MSKPSVLRAYATPFVFVVLSAGGLVIALVCDGAIDLAALLLIVTPLAVLARRFLREAREPSPSTRTKS